MPDEPNLLNILGDKSEQRLAAIYDSLATESQLKLKESLAYLIKNHENPKHSFETVAKRAALLEHPVATSALMLRLRTLTGKPPKVWTMGGCLFVSRSLWAR